MTGFAIAADAESALRPGAPLAREEGHAAILAGGPVFLAVEPLAACFATIADAEAALPGMLYGDPRFELAWMDECWRILVRYWRPAPPAPVARTALSAVQKPIGHARTPEEARALLGAPAEMAKSPLPRLYRTRARAAAATKGLLEQGLASLVEREGRFAVEVTYWRPFAMGARALLPAERAQIAARLAEPLRGQGAQEPLTFGLFEAIAEDVPPAPLADLAPSESLAPENPAIILVNDEGDGRGME